MRSYCYGLLLLVVFFTGCSTTAQQPEDPIPAHKTFTINSKQLGETRTINVWTPREYVTGTDSFFVLYMADGGIKEDFPHIANTIANLVKNKSIPPIILVGIENIQRRKDLTGHTDVAEDKNVAPVVGGAEKFRAFIETELFPEVKKQYRATEKKGIIGESLAGLFVVETFLLKPGMFDDYIAMDPSLWWNDHYLVKNAKDYLSKFPGTEKRCWFAGSDAEDVSVYTNQLAQILRASAPVNLTWNYSNEPKEKHSTIFRATKEKALIWTLNKK